MRKGMPQPAGPGPVPLPTSQSLHDASCPPISKARAPDGGDHASKPYPPLLPPSVTRDGQLADHELAAGSRETLQKGNPRTLPLDPLTLISEG
eukprot:543110-Prymnesium_polylepis.1